MTRSLRSSLVFTLSTFSFAAFGYAQGGLLLPNRGQVYSVKLTAADITGGSSLAATVYSKDPNSTAMAPANVVTDSRLRYTFSALRRVDGVCSDTKIIATNSPSGNLNVLKKTLPSGQYVGFSVHVTGLPTLNSNATNSDATVTKNFGVFQAVSSRATTWSFYPAAGTKGPAQVSIGLAIPSPPANTTFTFSITCGALCQPSVVYSGPRPDYSYTSSYKVSTMMQPGSPELDAYVSEYRIGWPGAPDCTFVGLWHVPKPNYYLVP
jgi:hypothetical protein